MKLRLFLLAALLGFGCKTARQTVSIPEPPANPVPEVAADMPGTGKISALSTFGTYQGYCFQPSVSTRLLKNNCNSATAQEVTTCLLQYKNTCCCIDGNYSLALAVDITDPTRFRSGQEITLPHPDIYLRADEITEERARWWAAHQPITGRLKFEKIVSDTIVLSLAVNVENTYSSNETYRRKHGTVVDYARLKFLPETLIKYEADHPSASATNSPASEFLFSLYPKTRLQFKHNFLRTKNQEEMEKLSAIATQAAAPEFAGGLKTLNAFFRQNLPCPDSSLTFAGPNTFIAYLKIAPEGNVMDSAIRTEAAFGNPYGNSLHDLAPESPLFARHKELLEYEARIKALLQTLPPFRITLPEGIDPNTIEYYTFEFPIIFDCSSKK